MFDSLRRHRSSLLAIGLLGLLTFVTLDNLILNMGTAIPDSHTPDRDDAIFYWSLWWFKYAILNLRTDPFFTNYILFPNTVNLSMHSHVFTLGLLSLPFQLFLDMHWIVNGWIVLSFFLSAVCMYVFLRGRLENVWIAILGATLYAFSANMVWRATHVHLSVMTLWWFPLSLLLWDKALERRSVGWSVALGICIYLAFMTYSELLLWRVLTLGPYMLYGLFNQRTWHARWQVAGLGGIAVLAALLPALVAPLPQMRQLPWNEYAWQDVSYVQSLATSPSDLFIRQGLDTDSTMGQILPALALICLAFTGRRRERWLWFAVGLFNVILALGPYLGEPARPLPFALLYRFSQGQYRTPGRLLTPASLGLAVFVSLSLANLFDHVRNRRVQVGILTAILFAHVLNAGLLAPFPVFTAPDYPIYRVIGADPEDHTLLQVPIGVAGSLRIIGPAAPLHYYGRFHHQRTINGTVSRLPAPQLDRYERTPFLLALALGNPLPPFEEARAEFLRRLKNWDIRYVVVHKDLIVGDYARSFIEFFNEQPEICAFYEDAETIGYRAINSWADCPRPDFLSVPSNGTLDLGEPGDDRFVGLGWYNAEDIGGVRARWAGEIQTSTLRVALPPRDIHVRFRAMAYPTDQTVAVTVNGQRVSVVKLAEDWADYDITVPKSMLNERSPNVITLTHARLESAFGRTGGKMSDDRPLAAAYDYLVFEPVR